MSGRDARRAKHRKAFERAIREERARAKYRHLMDVTEEYWRAIGRHMAEGGAVECRIPMTLSGVMFEVGTTAVKNLQHCEPVSPLLDSSPMLDISPAGFVAPPTPEEIRKKLLKYREMALNGDDSIYDAERGVFYVHGKSLKLVGITGVIAVALPNMLMMAATATLNVVVPSMVKQPNDEPKS